jgi:lipopolysaccharide export system ATP-binding protein
LKPDQATGVGHFDDDGKVSPDVADKQLKGLFVSRICKSYRRRPALTAVTLNVGYGEIVGLLGPDGAGKTTCFYAIVGLIRPASGKIFIDGVDVTRLPVYRRAKLGIGYLSQQTSIFRGMSVEQNILAVLELVELDRDVRHATLDALLEAFGLMRLRHAASISLSGGERRRVEIARALAGKPRIMLLDEPFAGIDPLTITEIHEQIVHLKGRGIGLLITDHNVREALSIIDRAYVIHDSSVLMSGRPEEITANDAVRHVYLGDNFHS